MTSASDSNFLIENSVKAKLPSLAFVAIKDTVLGKKYSLALHIVDEAEIKRLNSTYRKIDEVTDILSFPISEDTGEIFINLDKTKTEAVKFERTFENFFAYLFIHGLVHLKGHDHSSTMESIEKRIRSKFHI
ncbi:MAG: rRNA maturation RNase YbeY [Candidatus Taylorbacteria bacterium]|nr:rRNA maturation RNase YbeY [Candidatus Taylorbacteria bacterium]